MRYRDQPCMTTPGGSPINAPLTPWSKIRERQEARERKRAKRRRYRLRRRLASAGTPADDVTE